jgi:N-methylhydantoinase B
MSADPVTLEVIRNRLDTVAEEMEETLLRSAYSIILKEGADASSAIFTPAGDVIAQSTSHPLHLGALLPAVRRILQKYPVNSMQPGDVYCLNDPYDGGTHLPDLIVVVPGFFGDEVVVLAAALAHHQDFGGMAPGSMTISATEHFQEGLILGPLKLFEENKPNDTLFTIIDRNVRIPMHVIGDIHAQVAAGRKVAQRTVELIEEVGLQVFQSAVVQLLDHAESLTRLQIQSIPDGTYEFEDVIDNDGHDLERQLNIRVKVTVQGSDVEMDFTGTAAQARGPVNTSPTGAYGPAFYVLRAITDPTIPNNSGCYRPLKLIIPDGTLLNPHRPAPVSIRAHTLKRVVDVLFGAFAQACPERVPAASHGSLTCVSYGGTESSSGDPWVYMECSVGGTGGTDAGDGVDDLDTDINNAGNIPAEALELEHAFRLWAYRLRTDSGGAGLHRGGLGVERLIEFLEEEAVMSHRADRNSSAPWGLKGGKPGATWQTLILRSTGAVEEIPGRKTALLRRGDRLRILTGGGGGYGDPLDRSPELVLRDVEDGKVSRAAAFDEYGIVLRADGVCDNEATAAEREARRVASVDGYLIDRGDFFGTEARHSLTLG